MRRCVARRRKKLRQSPQGRPKGTAEVHPSRVLQFRRRLAGTEERKNQPIALRQCALPFAANVFGAHAIGREHEDDRFRLI